MPELQQKSFQRQVAFKVSISNLLNSNFEKDENLSGYIRLNDKIISRVNLMVTVVVKSEQSQNYASLLVDDGTGKILLRNFENIDAFSKVDVGDFILIIGKLREFNGEKYILPEALKKLNNIEWINVRRLELKKINYVSDNTESKNKNPNLAEEVFADTYDIIYSLIKNLDSGNGVFVDDVIKKSDIAETEKIITKLLESGNIFEVIPGKLKVLE